MKLNCLDKVSVAVILVGLLVIVALLVSGCAHFSATISETGTNGTVKITKTSAFTFYDSQSELSKLNISQGPRTNDQYIGLGSLNQTASSTNFNGLIQIIAPIIGAAALSATNK